MTKTGFFLTVWCLGVIAAIWFLPATRTFVHPTCTYRVNAEIQATVEVNGTLYQSTAIYRASQSRDWIEVINHGGCRQTHGTALVFRLKNDAAIFVPAGMCSKAETNVKWQWWSDIVADCNGKPRPDGDAFAVDNADNPSLWRQLTWEKDLKLVSMIANKSFQSTYDLIEQNAPGVLDANFDTGGSWWGSPERVIPFKRRREAGKDFEFQVQRGYFDLS